MENNGLEPPLAQPDAARPVEELELQPNDVDQGFINMLQEAIRRTRRLAQWQRFTKPFSWVREKVKKFIPESPLERATFFLLLWGTCFSIYEYIHMKDPTLALGDRATAAAEASAATAQYTAHRDWVFNVCPIEIARNMSTPECLHAVNETIPPPPRPQYNEFRSLQHLALRRLVPLINASYALQKEMLESDTRCGAKDASDLLTPSIDCLQPEVSEQSQKRSNTPNAWNILTGFPLPPTERVRYLDTLSARLTVGTSTYVKDLGLALLLALFWLFLTRRWPYHPNCRWYFKMHWRLYWSVWSILFCGLLANYSWVVLRSLSKDIFIETCLSTQTSIQKPADCAHLVHLSANLSPKDQIRTISC
ncbi:hypothetical protein GJ744_011986 [Endocarpon pusillum]|uniref:Uncharacterized protein n=1 Tax=Endocarpon pusillum TaxID=364733 RepID=A0A8H7APJ5_9EURO|nr:hypothetical protein GJ744_011986 [Endocarpon pusillum]